MTIEYDFHGPNLGYILELYERFQDDPDFVDESARRLFQHWKPPSTTAETLHSTPNLFRSSQAVDLAQAIRSRGYLAATLDPLGTKPVNDPSLTLEFHKLHENDLRQLPADAIGLTGRKRPSGYRTTAYNLLREYWLRLRTHPCP